MDSEFLRQKRESAKRTPPPPYDRPKSWLDFWERVLPTGFKAVLSLAVIELVVFLLTQIPAWRTQGSIPAIGILAALFMVLFMIFWVYRALWALKNRHIRIDPSTGLMEIDQRGPWWLALPDSDPDTFNINDVQILDTKDRRFFQRRDLPWPIKYITFDCGDIKLPGNRPPLKNVQEIPQILAIQRYRKGLASRSIENEDSMIELDDAILRQLEIQTGLLEQLVWVFNSARVEAARRTAEQEDTVDTGPIDPIEAEEVDEDSLSGK